MSMTDVNQVSEQVQKKWGDLFMKELRESLLLGGLVNKNYDGAIGQQGDTVYVSQINAPVGQLRTVGTDADTFDSQLLSTTRISIQANKRAVASFELSELAVLQSQLGSQDSEIRESLKFAMAQQVNDYLFSLVSASTSAPDHLTNSVTDFNAAQVAGMRMRAAQAKWRPEGGWWILCDPSYYSDLLNASTLTSSDYGATDAPVIGGQMAKQRFGFNILEDNSMVTDSALAFHPDFLHLVTQLQPRFKLSDLHSQKKFGYILSVDMVFGAAAGISSGSKCQVTVAAASGQVIH